MRYRLRRDVFSESVDMTGKAVSEGWLPAGTVVTPATDNDNSPWTNQSRNNHARGRLVRVLQHADGSPAGVVCRELLVGVQRMAEVADEERTESSNQPSGEQL